jgi:hypothetical protein
VQVVVEEAVLPQETVKRVAVVAVAEEAVMLPARLEIPAIRVVRQLQQPIIVFP